MLNKLLHKHHSELPLKEDRANLFLEISTAISVFLFSIALAAYFMISAVIKTWNSNIIDGLTVQIMPSEQAISADEQTLRIGKVIHFFEGLDGVKKVVPVNEEKIKRLIAPWLGANADIDALPLAKLIDVRLYDGKNFDFEKAADNLREIAPYASIDNHGIWLKQLVKSATSLKTLSIFVLTMVLVASVFSIMYAVSTSLKVHQNIIEILHIMGATDAYIAKQYAKRGFVVGLTASLIGMFFSMLCLRVISHLSSGLETGLIGSAKLDGLHWFLLLCLPLGVAVLSMLTSYLSVKHTLKEMM